MSKYWLANIKHWVQTEDGKVKKQNSVYLVDAVNHTEVEARLTKEMEPIIKGDFEIKPIRDSGISEIFEPNPKDWYFLVKYEFFAEKKQTATILVAADDCREAIDVFSLEMNEFMLDYIILGVSRTPVLNVYLWEAKGFEEKWTDESRRWEFKDDNGKSVASGSISFSNTDDEEIDYLPGFTPGTETEEDPIEDIIGSIEDSVDDFDPDAP